MMRPPFKSLSRQASKTNRVTILVLVVLLLFLGFWGIWYWRYVEEQTLHLQERNFRSLTVTSQALAGLVANYEKVLRSVIEGNPCENKDTRCPEGTRLQSYKNALNNLEGFTDVMVAIDVYENQGMTLKFVRENGASYMRLRNVHQDRTETKWKIETSIDIGTVVRPLVTEEIFSDVLMADHTGRVLYHQPSRLDSSGFEFDNVSSLLHRINNPERNDGEREKAGAKDVVATLPLFNDTRIGEVPYTIFAQAAILPAQRGIAQTLILVGIVPAGQFYAEARAIPLNSLLLIVGVILSIVFALPYIKLRINLPTQRLTAISITVLFISTILGTALLTFGLVDFVTYRNLEQHLDARLKSVSEMIQDRFSQNLEKGLLQLDAFDKSCNTNGSACEADLKKVTKVGASHAAQRMCLGTDSAEEKKELFFYLEASGKCSGDSQLKTKVVYPNVSTMLWVQSTGELKVLWSLGADPWKSVNLKERQYVRRIDRDDTFKARYETVAAEKRSFWIEPIFSWTTGENSAVISTKSMASMSSDGGNPDEPIVAALEVRLPSVTEVGVPPGVGFAVIDQQGKVLFHSDARRNLRENFFEETDRDGRLQPAVFARATTQFDGRYWGKDRHFHITPLFLAQTVEPGSGQGPEPIIESPPDVHWSLVTYWDIDMLRVLNIHTLYSSGALFLVYMIGALIIGILGWWTYPHVNERAYRWVLPQPEHLPRYEAAIWLLVLSLGAVGVWYVRPPNLAMLLWGVLPIFAAVVVALSIHYRMTDDTDKIQADLSVRQRQRYRQFYALVITAVLLTGVVMPALVMFRVSVDVEWRLLARFAQFDLDRDRALQAQGIQDSHRDTLYGRSEARTQFLQRLLDERVAYINFPFEIDLLKNPERDSSSVNVDQRWDEHLIRWLYHIIDRPRVGHSGVETGIFLESEKSHKPEWGTLEPKDRSSGTTTATILRSEIPTPIPQWLYSLLIFGGLIPFLVFRIKKIYVFAAAVCVLGGFLLFGFVGEAVSVLLVCAVLHWACYVMPKFAAQRVVLLDFPHPPSNSQGHAQLNFLYSLMEGGPTGGAQEDNDSHEKPSSWSASLWDAFVIEMSALRNALRLTEIQWSEELTKSCRKILELDVEDDLDVGKEQIIREILEDEKITLYYRQIWEKRTESQRRSLFNLARDGFLHSRNPDIGPLLKSGLIVADLNPRPMSESFRRFIIRAGVKERLDEDIAQEKASMWFQVWRPIGVGLVLVMVFLVLTQEQYRAITLAFLGVLPGLLGAFSQALTAPKKEKLDTASSA
jgi:hypothetical protein